MIMEEENNTLTINLQGVIENNAIFLNHIFSSHPNNRKSLVSDHLDLNEKDIDKIYIQWLYDGFKDLLPKKPVKRVSKQIKTLREFGILTDKEAMSISIPYNTEKTEDIVKDIEFLEALGYKCQYGTVRKSFFE